MQLDFNPENLDRYFKKQLSDVEKNAMEQKIAQDPLLKSEIDFQQEVIEAICQRRKWEIKQRLDAIAPEPSPLFSLPRIAFGTTLTIAGLLTATLFWFDNKKAAKAPQRTIEQKPIVKNWEAETKQKAEALKTPIRSSAPSSTPLVAIPKIAEAVAIAAPKISEEVVVKENKPEDICTASQEEAFITAQEAFVKLYDEMLWKEGNNTADNDNGAFDRDSEDEQSLNRIIYNQMLRYQYYNRQLSLYNNQSAGKQFHIHIDGKERHFLFYEGIYYEFFDGQMTETIMQPIRDKQVLLLVRNFAEAIENNQ